MIAMYHRLAKCLFSILICAYLAGCATVSSEWAEGQSEEGQSEEGSAELQAIRAQQCHGVHATYKVKGRRYWVQSEVATGHTEVGLASWYGRFFHGRRTASGDIFNMHRLTAAHKTLPLFALVKVTNLDTTASVFVTVNDRGPFVDGRIIDLSYQAARELGMLKAGVVPVEVRVVSLPPALSETLSSAASADTEQIFFNSGG